MSANKMIVRAKVRLEATGAKFKPVEREAHDSHGLAVGNTYFFDETGRVPGHHEWEITKITEAEG